MTHAHDDVFGSASADAQLRRQSPGIYDQGMIAHRREWVFQRTKNGLRIMEDIGQLAVHDRGGADDLAAEGRPDALMSQAAAENRGLAPQAPYDIAEYPGLFRSAGAGGDYDLFRFEPFNLLQRDLIVPGDLNLRSYLS